jgi:hypothetical protein
MGGKSYIKAGGVSSPIPLSLGWERVGVRVRMNKES